MNWLLLGEIVYVLIVIAVCLRVVYDTRTTTKTLAYLLMIVFLPFVGIFIYFSFGINYRKNNMYSKKLFEDEDMANRLTNILSNYSKEAFEKGNEALNNHQNIAKMLLKESFSPITYHNELQLLNNGEEKFPAVLGALKEAKKTIHFEYYIYEDDDIGRQIEQVLIQKVGEGVSVRFIYDDFGSSDIRGKLVKRLKQAGVEAMPFLKIKFVALANRLNYRNHRKIIVIDGQVAFVGGINVSDKYINGNKNNDLYWRDTHLKITGTGAWYLQYVFLCDWQFCSGEKVELSADFFPRRPEQQNPGKMLQIAASGPDSRNSVILFTILQAIYSAKKEICITSPYFIPGDGLLDALSIAALSGVRVRILVPGISDSKLVNAAASSYYSDLLDCGVEIYKYQKGFIHAKTLFIDREVGMIGTANMDFRSFDLNFEVNAIVYDKDFVMGMAEQFEIDLSNAEKIDPFRWQNRRGYLKFLEQLARLMSPLL
ncbi:cardiolipin synthase [Pedobacter sp. ASV28]|uniref:cardiolipin synthase n=1 Tax=Pedobacter sp. ASV28 TaxID=2795123 RepID=UPI0018ECAE4C|nr:cardiolipin synthase [Pedobacter sp. ASV28]